MKLRQNAVTAMFVALSLAVGAGVVGCKSAPQRESAGEYVSDAAITAKVKQELVQAQDVSWGAINVETYRGVVSLSGFVDSEGEIERAVYAAKGVRGVTEVKNDLHIKPADKRLK